VECKRNAGILLFDIKYSMRDLICERHQLLCFNFQALLWEKSSVYDQIEIKNLKREKRLISNNFTRISI